jgi:hypothetical protein
MLQIFWCAAPFFLKFALNFFMQKRHCHEKFAAATALHKNNSGSAASIFVAAEASNQNARCIAP